MTTTHPGRSCAVLLALAAALLVACSPTPAIGSPPVVAHRGEVISVRPIASVSVEQARAELVDLKLDVAAVRYGFDAVRLDYRTLDAAGRPTTASALLAVPVGAPGPRPIVSYGHGTIIEAAAAPTAFGPDEARPVAAVFASRGSYLLAADYLGWGTGDGPQAYVHAPSETTAMRDALVAARAWLLDQHRPVREQTFVTGFSQGGQAALALADDLTRVPVPGLRLAATAGVAGPYDLAGTQVPAVLDPDQVDPDSAVVYIALLLTSYERLYDLYGDPAEVFAAPYDRLVPALLDGTHTAEEIGAALPPSPSDLLTPAWRAQLREPSGRFLEALRANDTCEFRAVTPVRLYVSSGDHDVPAENSTICRNRLRALGADVRTVGLGHVEHRGAAVLALPEVAAWFAGPEF